MGNLLRETKRADTRQNHGALNDSAQERQGFCWLRGSGEARQFMLFRVDAGPQTIGISGVTYGQILFEAEVVDTERTET